MLFIGFVIGIALLAIAFAHFDKLLKFQYRQHKTQWEKSGRSGGFFWSQPASPFFSGSVQRTIRMLSWTFGNEEWMRSDAKLIKAAWVMRLCIFLFWLVWISIVIGSY